MSRKRINQILIGIALSFVLWYIVFLTDYLWSFWYRVTTASLILTLYAKLTGTQRIKAPMGSELCKGLVSGAGLYIAFFIGFNVFKSSLLTGAVSVYTFRGELPLMIPAVFLLVTSFCEEYFWRHYVQSNLEKAYGVKGIIVTSMLYASIHIPTLNAPLVVAALIAGVFWGVLYHNTGYFWMVVFSHMVWTELVFVFLPLA